MAKAQDTRSGHRALDAAIAALPVRDAGLSDHPKLPAVRWRSGAPMSKGALDWFVGQLSLESLEGKSGTLWAVRSRLVDEDCHRLTAALIAAAGYTDLGWPLMIRAVTGSAEDIEWVAARLDNLASSAVSKWGDEGVEVLVRAGTDSAIRHLDHASRKSRRSALRWRARVGLERIASWSCTGASSRRSTATTTSCSPILGSRSSES